MVAKVGKWISVISSIASVVRVWCCGGWDNHKRHVVIFVGVIPAILGMLPSVIVCMNIYVVANINAEGIASTLTTSMMLLLMMVVVSHVCCAV